MVILPKSETRAILQWVGLTLKWKEILEKLNKLEGNQERQLVVCALKYELVKVGDKEHHRLLSGLNILPVARVSTAWNSGALTYDLKCPQYPSVRSFPLMSITQQRELHPTTPKRLRRMGIRPNDAQILQYQRIHGL